MRIPQLGVSVALLVAVASSAQAAPVLPTSYDMRNGETGSFQYWDETYSGSGSVTTSGATLTGGLGDLTDGIIASDNWFVTEAPAGNGPYVAWDTFTPTITFNFTAGTIIDAMTIYADDANGNGGVSTPSSVVINGGAPIALTDGASGAPLSFTFSGLGITGPLSLTINDGLGQWVFLSEVTFDGRRQVPEPAALAMFGLALAGFGIYRSRRRR